MLFCAASLLSLVPAGGTGARAQSIDDALAGAYQTSPVLQAERSQTGVADEKVPQALSNWRPVVTVTANAGITHNAFSPGNAPGGQAAAIGIGTLRSVGYGLTVVQPIFRGGRTVAQTDQAENLVRSEVAHLNSVEQIALLAAATDYLDVLRFQQQVEISRDGEAFMRRLVDETRTRFQRNNVSATDVAQAEAGLAEMSANRRQAEGALEGARASFLRDTGQAPRILQPADRALDLPANGDQAVNLAVTNNPDVVSAQFAEQAAEDHVRLVRGQLLPTLALEGSVQRNRDPAFALERLDTEAVTLNLTMPLYESGLFYSETRAALKAVEVAKSEVDTARQRAHQAATFTWEQLAASHDAAVFSAAEVDSDTRALDGVARLANFGTRTVRDVVLAVETLFQARGNLAQAQHDEGLAKFTLAGLVGHFTARELALPVEYFDPDRYYNAVRDKWLGFGPAE